MGHLWDPVDSIGLWMRSPAQLFGHEKTIFMFWSGSVHSWKERERERQRSNVVFIIVVAIDNSIGGNKLVSWRTSFSTCNVSKANVGSFAGWHLFVTLHAIGRPIILKPKSITLFHNILANPSLSARLLLLLLGLLQYLSLERWSSHRHESD